MVQYKNNTDNDDGGDDFPLRRARTHGHGGLVDDDDDDRVSSQ